MRALGRRKKFSALAPPPPTVEEAMWRGAALAWASAVVERGRGVCWGVCRFSGIRGGRENESWECQSNGIRGGRDFVGVERGGARDDAQIRGGE